MRLKTARTPRRWRSARTLVSVRAVRLARRASEKPSIFRRRSACGVAGQAVGAQAGLLVDDLADAGEEPGVVAGDGVDGVVGEAVAHGLGDEAQAVGGLGARAP